jgi:hypothetical protein
MSPWSNLVFSHVFAQAQMGAEMERVAVKLGSDLDQPS